MRPIQNTRERDLERAEILLEGAKPNVEAENFDAPTVEALEEAMSLFEKWELKERVAEVYQYWGDYQYEIEQADAAITMYRQSLDLRLEFYGKLHEKVGFLHAKIGDIYNFLHDFKNAKIHLYEALDICNQIYKSKNRLACNIYFALGVWHNYQQQSIVAIDYFHLSLLNVDSTIPKVYLANIYLNLGKTYSTLYNFSKAQYFLKKGINLIEKNYPPTHQSFHYAYYTYAKVFIGMGDFYRARLYIQKAIQIGKHYQSPHLFHSYYILFDVYFKQSDYANAVKVGELILSFLAENKLEKHGGAIMNYTAISTSYIKIGKFKKAFHLLNKTVSLSKELFGSKSWQLAYSFQNMGAYYVEQNSYDNALKYFNKALEIIEYIDVDKKQKSGIVMSYMGDMYLKNRKYLSATECYHKSLFLFFNSAYDEDYYTYPKMTNKMESIDSYFFSFDGVKLFLAKANALLQVYLQNTYLPKNLQASLKGYKLAFDILDQVRQSFLSTTAKLTIIKSISSETEKAILAAYQLFQLNQDEAYLEDTLLFSEKSKAYLMLANRKEKAAKQLLQLPKDLLEKEQQVQSHLIMLQKNIQILEQRGQNVDQQLLQKWQDDYLVTFNKFESLKKQLETDYPDYYRQKYSTETVSISSLQSSLQSHQTVLSYFIGEEKIYLFAITSDEYEVFAMEKPDNFTDLIQNYLQSIKFHQKEKFQQLSFELYQILLQEAIDYLIDLFEDETREVFIIPHAELHYLPFETLIIQEAQSSKTYSEFDYLLNHCQISYHYSATLLHLDLQKQAIQAERAPNDIAFTGFAPVYETTSNEQKQALEVLQQEYATAVNRSEAVRSDGTWMPLPYSRLEVENIVQLFEAQGLEGQAFLYESATKRNLEEQIGKSRFVLIAAHGIVNNDYPELSGLVLSSNDRRRTVDARQKQESGNSEESINGVENLPSFDSPFGGDKGEVSGDIRNGQKNSEQITAEDCLLNMKEVAMIPMSADLVVLSSCESGIGKLHKGEGMMAVNRGFLESGAKNVVSTLFKVNDQASSELTTLLFQFILEGETYVAALQKAKLELLKKRQDLSPKMWSGFVLFGIGGNKG